MVLTKYKLNNVCDNRCTLDEVYEKYVVQNVHRDLHRHKNNSFRKQSVLRSRRLIINKKRALTLLIDDMIVHCICSYEIVTNIFVRFLKLGFIVVDALVSSFCSCMALAIRQKLPPLLLPLKFFSIACIRKRHIMWSLPVHHPTLFDFWQQKITGLLSKRRACWWFDQFKLVRKNGKLFLRRERCFTPKWSAHVIGRIKPAGSSFSRDPIPVLNVSSFGISSTHLRWCSPNRS